MWILVKESTIFHGGKIIEMCEERTKLVYNILI